MASFGESITSSILSCVSLNFFSSSSNTSTASGLYWTTSILTFPFVCSFPHPESIVPAAITPAIPRQSAAFPRLFIFHNSFPYLSYKPLWILVSFVWFCNTFTKTPIFCTIFFLVFCLLYPKNNFIILSKSRINYCFLYRMLVVSVLFCSHQRFSDNSQSSNVKIVSF